MNDDYFIGNYRYAEDTLNRKIEFIKAYSAAMRIENTKERTFIWFLN